MSAHAFQGRRPVRTIQARRAVRTILVALALASSFVAGCDPKSSSGAIGIPKPASAGEKMDPSKMNSTYEPAPKTKLDISPQPNTRPKLAADDAPLIDDNGLQPLP